MDAELQAAFDGLRQHFDRRLDGVDQRFDRVDQRFEQVDQHLARLDQGAVETRHYFDIVAEGLRRDMALVAEGFDRVDRLEIVLRDEIRRSHDELAGMIRVVDRRVQILERRAGDPD